MYYPGRYYAEVKWHAEDVLSLKPDWTHEQAVDFLERNEKRLQDRVTELGWEVIDTLISLE
jgi:hypothetical protein